MIPQFDLHHFLHQAANIAHAMKWLHDGLPIDDRVYIVCHMDLTPVNVLVFLDQASQKEPVGKWKIADFGISSLQEKETEERQAPRQRSNSLAPEAPASSLAHLTARTVRINAARPAGAFQAPEVDTRSSIVGRASDVWSFGCILFQILARGVGPGTEKLRELNNLRAKQDDGIVDYVDDFFYREEEGKKFVNPHVMRWLAQPPASNASYMGRSFVPDCKKLISQMLRIDPNRRPKAHEVNDSLWKLLIPVEEVQSPVEEERRHSQLSSAQPAVSVPQISVTFAPPTVETPPLPGASPVVSGSPTMTASRSAEAAASPLRQEPIVPPRPDTPEAPRVAATITDFSDLWHVPVYSDETEDAGEESSRSVQERRGNRESRSAQATGVENDTNAEPVPRKVPRASTMQNWTTFAQRTGSRQIRSTKNPGLQNPGTTARHMSTVGEHVQHPRDGAAPRPGDLRWASASYEPPASGRSPWSTQFYSLVDSAISNAAGADAGRVRGIEGINQGPNRGTVPGPGGLPRASTSHVSPTSARVPRPEQPSTTGNPNIHNAHATVQNRSIPVIVGHPPRNQNPSGAPTRPSLTPPANSIGQNTPSANQRPSPQPVQQRASDANQLSQSQTQSSSATFQGLGLHITSSLPNAARSQSNASSFSLISVETPEYSTSRFTAVSGVIQSLISTSGNLAFITKNGINIRDMKDTQFCTIRMKQMEWEGGSMAGDYLAAVGMANSKQVSNACTRTPLKLTIEDLSTISAIIYRESRQPSLS